MIPKTLQKLHEAKTQIRHGVVFDTHPIKEREIKALRIIIAEAIHSVESAKHLCLAAGQMLNEIQGQLEHGEFQPFIEKYLPEISIRTAERWARAAANITRALPPPTIDISVGEILSMPEEGLSAAAKKYKQAWFDFTSDKTIKDCLRGVFVEGDDAVRADRAINGKTKGGTNANDNRKDYSLFAAQKFEELANHFSNWKKFTALQRSELTQILGAAILGQEVTLTRKGRAVLFDFTGRTQRRAPWPREICELALAALKERLKQSD